MKVRVIFLPDCTLVLSLHKHKDVGTFLNLKKREFQKGEVT